MEKRPTKWLKWQEPDRRRLAAITVGDLGILVVDPDRFKDRFLPDCKLDRDEINLRLFKGDRIERKPPASCPEDQYVAVREWLVGVALSQGPRICPSNAFWVYIEAPGFGTDDGYFNPCEITGHNDLEFFMGTHELATVLWRGLSVMRPNLPREEFEPLLERSIDNCCVQVIEQVKRGVTWGLLESDAGKFAWRLYYSPNRVPDRFNIEPVVAGRNYQNR